MDLTNTASNTNSGNSDSISTVPPARSRATYSSPSTSSATDTRRSVRLSAKSPKKTSLLPNESGLHRTISGSVGSHSQKLNARKRSSGGHSGQSASTSSISYSITTSEDNGVGPQNDNNNNNVVYQNLLPSDQSDDDEMLIDNNVPVTRKSTRLATRTEVLSYFLIQHNGFKCILCNNVYQSNKHSDANLRKHLASISHQIPNMLFTSQKNDNSKVQVPIVTSEQRRKLHSAAIECIIRDSLSFGVFRRPGMAHFLQTAVPKYVGPHRKTVRSKIASIYSSYTTKLRSIISKVQFIALTCDLWRSSRRLHYISLTGHVFTNTYDTIPMVLGCRRLIGRHLSTNIERYITFELNRLNIKREQIISITTDNGSEMKKATSTFMFGNRISCMAHNLNLVVKHGLCLWKEPNAKDFPLDLDVPGVEWADVDDADDSSSEADENLFEVAADLISDEDGDADDASSGEDTNLNKPANDEFESDSDADLNFSTLAINDNQSNKSNIDHQELLGSIFQLMNKTRAGIKLIRHHNTVNEYVLKNISSKPDGEKGGLILDMIIRWNSSYLLLKRLTSNKSIVMDVFSFPNNFNALTEKQKKKLHGLTLTPNEWELLNQLRVILEPFQEATIALSGRNYPTIAASFIIWRLLTSFLNKKTNDPVQLAMKESLRFRFQIYLDYKLPQGQLETMKVAAFLDTLTYKRMIEDDRKSARKIIFRKLQNSTVTKVISPTSSSQLVTTSSDPLDKLAMLCGETEGLKTSTATKRPQTVDEEISSYVDATSTATSFKEFWITHEKALPRLARLVKQTHIIPATSVASESLFSIASFLNRKQRSSLSSQTLRYLLVLKDRHVLDNLDQLIE